MNKPQRLLHAESWHLLPGSRNHESLYRSEVCYDRLD
jgi:hypothetical protein